MQSRWKEWEQGIILSVSPSLKSSRHTAQSCPAISPISGARRLRIALVDAGTPRKRLSSSRMSTSRACASLSS
uniref:Uncharacterized protein n=1 Tax=Arundo donax TaxID=35708 RepID=A0A0A8ZWI6_ARUDO